MPEDISDAFRAITDETRRQNRVLFHELARIIEALANDGMEAIPFKGPVLAIEAFGDLGLRVFKISTSSFAIATLLPSSRP